MVCHLTSPYSALTRPGVDVVHALIESVGSTADIAIHLQSYYEYPVPNLLRKRILSLCRLGADTTLEEICDLNFELGEMFAAAVAASGIPLDQVDLIASHGSTLWHTPEGVNEGAGFCRGQRRMATLQMGEGAVLSHRSGM
jgi:anhydro-N-acetylmuramic acid kinase